MSAEDRPDLHSPEFRRSMYLQTMEVLEAANISLALADRVELMRFQDLDPEKWARVLMDMEAVRKAGTYTRDALSMMTTLMENPGAIDMVADMVDQHQEKS